MVCLCAWVCTTRQSFGQAERDAFFERVISKKDARLQEKDALVERVISDNGVLLQEKDARLEMVKGDAKGKERLSHVVLSVAIAKRLCTWE